MAYTAEQFQRIAEKFESKGYLFRNVFGEAGGATVLVALRIASNLYRDEFMAALLRRVADQSLTMIGGEHISDEDLLEAEIAAIRKALTETTDA